MLLYHTKTISLLPRIWACIGSVFLPRSCGVKSGRMLKAGPDCWKHGSSIMSRSDHDLRWVITMGSVTYDHTELEANLRGMIYEVLGKALWPYKFSSHCLQKFCNPVLWVNVLKVPVQYSYYLYWKKCSNTFIQQKYIEQHLSCTWRFSRN